MIDKRRRVDDVEPADPLEVVLVPDLNVAVLDDGCVGGWELDMDGHIVGVGHIPISLVFAL
jgi:hypothetical protein